MPSFLTKTLLLSLAGIGSAKSGCSRAKSSTTRSLTDSLNSDSTASAVALQSSTVHRAATAAATQSLTTTAAITTTPLASSSSTGAASQVPEGFKPGAKWQIAIQDPVDMRGGLQPADATVVDIDLFLASKDSTVIPALHAAGATVLCYFNAGAVQYTDCDWPDWDEDGLFSGATVANYDQEHYVDVTSSTVLALHKARIDLAHSIGCDGIDPDNIDTYQLDADESVGKQITQDDMIAFLTELSTYAHSKTTTLGFPLMIGQKNAVELTDRIHTIMDFAISENCIGSDNVGSNRGSTDEFCSVFQAYYTENDKPVFDIEYPASLIAGGSSSSTRRRRWARSTTGRRDTADITAAETGCSAGTSTEDLAYYCAAAAAASATTNTTTTKGISRILKLDDDDYGLNGCTQYCAEERSFVLTTYESNSTNSCCFGSSC